MEPFVKLEFGEPKTRTDDSRAWGPPHEKLMYSEVITLQQKQKQLEENLAQLRTIKILLRSKKATRALQEAEENASYISDNLVEKLWGQVPVMNRPNLESAAKAEEVFDITELLERIILCLPVPDQLTAMSINKTFHGTILASAKILRGLGLREGTVYSSPFTNRHTKAGERHMDTFGIRQNFELYDFEPPWRWLHDKPEDRRAYGWKRQFRDIEPDPKVVNFHFYHEADVPLPEEKLGSRVRDMLLVQPPVRTLRVRTRWFKDQGMQKFNPASHGIDKWGEIESSNAVGFTLGEVLDYEKGVRERHRREVENGHFGRAGQWFITVHFWGEVRLGEDDRIYKERMKNKFVKRWMKRNDKAGSSEEEVEVLTQGESRDENKGGERLLGDRPGDDQAGLSDTNDGDG